MKVQSPFSIDDDDAGSDADALPPLPDGLLGGDLTVEELRDVFARTIRDPKTPNRDKMLAARWLLTAQGKMDTVASEVEKTEELPMAEIDARIDEILLDKRLRRMLSKKIADADKAEK